MKNAEDCSGVYKITNTINDKIYIGSATTSFKQRWRKGYNRYLVSALTKYSKANFRFEVLLVCEPVECLRYEQAFMDHFQPWVETGRGYNIAKIAGSNLGVACLPETKERLSHANIGKKMSADAKKKIGLASIGNKYRLGHRHSEESLAKMSAAHKGNRSNTGRRLTKKHKENISNAIKGMRIGAGRVIPAVQRANISEGMKKVWQERKRKKIEGGA